MTPLTIAFCARICRTIGAELDNRKGIGDRENDQRDPQRGREPTQHRSRAAAPRNDPGARRQRRRRNGNASNTALNFDPTASPTTAAASSHAPHP